MPTIDRHIETLFSYADLRTTDLQQAVSFYTALFGWGVEEVPSAGGASVRFTKGDRTTATASAQTPAQRDAGLPAMWTTYFTVYDLESRTKRAAQAGGVVHAGPLEVGEAGRTSVIQDPNGAFFALWEPRGSIGSEVMQEPDALTWSACTARDVDAGREFYASLFGWTFDELEVEGGVSYTVFKKEGVDRLVAGLMGLPAEGMPSFWLDYFWVEGCDARARQVEAAGGRIVDGPTDRPNVGRLAVVADPGGAVFGIVDLDEAAIATICGFFDAPS